MSALPTPPACAGGQLYTVARGDTVFLLAQRFNTTVDVIRAANPQLTNPNVLVIGQQLCLPGAPAPAPGPFPLPPACVGGTLVTVQPGETMGAIARRFNVGLQTMIAANPQVIDPNILLVGQRLCVPALAPGPGPVPTCPAGTLRYVVERGETLASIARRFGLGLPQVIAANPQLTDPNVLIPGQSICVPVAVPPGTPPPPTCTGRLYVVAPGETLTGIARVSGVTVQAILQANPQITDPATLAIGQSICIPLG